jgi:hypothetical protein
MNIKIETYAEYKYDEIQKEYGSVLHKFGLAKSDDGNAYVSINRLEDLFELDKEIRNFCDEQDKFVYFGIVVKHFNEEPLLEIKDNYD